MPVIVSDVMGVKTVTFYPGNAELGLHTHMAIVELLRRATGEPLAVMDGRLITEMRTAAVSAVAFAALAPHHFAQTPRSFGILGSGVQTRAHLRALRLVWPEMSEVRIWSRTRENAERLVSEIMSGGVMFPPRSQNRDLGHPDSIRARAVDIEEASAADVVLTATSATEPVLQGRFLAPNALVLAVGATGASVRELDDEVMRTSFVVAESRSCVERESGDVRFSGAKVEAEIGEVLLNPDAVALPRGRRTLFKSVGMAIEDVTAARLVWQARQR
jgi:thiomorpholine-carboxylate dehydrogenase